MSAVIFGAPGSGKGTQSALLLKRNGYAHISTGDIMRSAIKAETELGKKVKSFLDAGALVPDVIVIDLIKQVLSGLSGKSFILDGFPRTITQAEALDTVLKTMHVALKKAVFLEVETESLVRRLIGRRLCKGCGTVFHLESKPSKVNGICDKCGSELYQRSDDKEDVIRARLDTYEKNTAPLKAYYQKAGMFVSVNGGTDEESVYKQVLSSLN